MQTCFINFLGNFIQLLVVVWAENQSSSLFGFALASKSLNLVVWMIVQISSCATWNINLLLKIITIIKLEVLDWGDSSLSVHGNCGSRMASLSLWHLLGKWFRTQEPQIIGQIYIQVLDHTGSQYIAKLIVQIETMLRLLAKF